MGTKDPRVDVYIAKAQPFAQPILKYLRAVVHSACPDVQETMKWSFPHFDYKGIFCAMAGFKQHCTFGFWKRSLLKESVKGIPSGVRCVSAEPPTRVCGVGDRGEDGGDQKQAVGDGGRVDCGRESEELEVRAEMNGCAVN
jgi:hypothetical protein